ncbi:class I SAM-dependent methyltransferase [Gordonia sihwensis]|nr:class I SAM-dependent methyltransferase [Gordonia sihwensis]WFN94815.1 class I SAM-dependent methyltransferase [Gordonia sihwensis]
MMKEPSRTALATAYARAYHQVADSPRILDDPFAVRLIGSSGEALSRAAEDGRLPVAATDRRRRLFFAARARFAEDRVAAAAARGVGQVVVLGAGLDTFGYRSTDPGLRVFEVDHPATQEWKRERLAEAAIDVPATTTLVPVDFETDDLAESLASAGFRRDAAAVFVWLGVVYYLTPEAARSTLEYVAGQTSSAEVILDYLEPATDDAQRARMQARAERVAAVGEPWFNFYDRDDLGALLRDLRFHDVEDLSAAELIGTYTGRTTEATSPSRILWARG